MTLKGVDISHWQSGIKVNDLPVDFVICKATEGVGYTDRCCDGFVQACIDTDKLWGFYHFARTNSPEEEADYFINECRNYFGHGIPVLDYEVDNVDNVKWCERFMSRVHEQTGVWPLLYISASRCRQYKGSWIPDKCGHMSEEAWEKYANPAGKGATQTQEDKTSKACETLADEVISGKWGNGEDRRKRLTQAYDAATYEHVQRIVNDRLR